MNGSESNPIVPLKAGILAIGNEVLNGIVLDTNSNWIEQRLALIGIEMRRLVIVRDEIDEIGKALHFLLDDCNVIITSGGLGPTHDDMTMKAISVAIDKPLVENANAIEIVRRQYKILYERGIVASPEITESRKKMAQIPKDSVPLDNIVGGAPGVMFEYRGATVFCLPGVPSELKDIWTRSVHPWLENNNNQAYYEKIVEFPFRDESAFAPYINTVMKSHDMVWIKSMPKSYGSSKVLRVWISCRGPDLKELESQVKSAIRELEKLSRLKAQLVE